MTMSLKNTTASSTDDRTSDDRSRPRLPVPDAKRVTCTDSMRRFDRSDRNERDDQHAPIPLPGDSSTTTFASGTDDGDYETSSEGPARAHENNEIKAEISRRSHSRNSGQEDESWGRTTFCKESIMTRQRKALLDESREKNVREQLTWKNDVSHEKRNALGNIPMKSESLPILKSVSSDPLVSEDRKFVNAILTSESSFACEKKMKMILTYMDSLLPSDLDRTMAAKIGASESEFPNEECELKKFESHTVLPILENLKVESGNRTKEVTFLDTKPFRDSDRDSNTGQYTTHRSVSEALTTEIDHSDGNELIDIANNPHPSIKSFYFPPTPQDTISEQDNLSILRASKQSRVSNNFNTLLRIVGEFGPLRHQLSEITGKYRALNLSEMPLDPRSARHLDHQSYPGRSTLSPNSSGYFLRRAETFSQDTSNDYIGYTSLVGKPSSSQSPPFAVVGKSASHRSAESSADINALDENRAYRRQDSEYLFNPESNAGDKNGGSSKGNFTYGVNDTNDSRRSVRYCETSVDAYASCEQNFWGSLSKERAPVDSTMGLRTGHRREVVVDIDGESVKSGSNKDRDVVRRLKEPCYSHSQRCDRMEYYDKADVSCRWGQKLYESREDYLPRTLGTDPALNRDSCLFHGSRNASKCVQANDADVLIPERNSKDRASLIGSDADWASYHSDTNFVTKLSRDDFRQRDISVNDDCRSDRQKHYVTTADKSSQLILRTHSKASCTPNSMIYPRTHVVSVNTELTTIVEKHYSDRAVSPIRDLAPRTKAVTSSEAPTESINYDCKHRHAPRKSSKHRHYCADHPMRNSSSTTAQKSVTPSQRDFINITSTQKFDEPSRNRLAERKAHRHSTSSINTIHSTKLIYTHNPDKSISATFHRHKSFSGHELESHKDHEKLSSKMEIVSHRRPCQKHSHLKDPAKNKAVSVQAFDIDHRVPNADAWKNYHNFSVQMSGSNVKHCRPDISLPQSLQSLLKPHDPCDAPRSEYDRAEIQMPDADEKLVIVPVIFTSDIPEPPQYPIFNFAKPKCLLRDVNPKPSHRVVTIERRNPRRSFSTLSGGSTQYPGSCQDEDSLNVPEHWVPTGRMSFSRLNRSVSSMHQKNTSSSSCVGRCSRTSNGNGQGLARVTSGAIVGSRGSVESNGREDKPVAKVIRGMRSSPEDFLCDT